MNIQKIFSSVEEIWDNSTNEAIKDFIRVPAISPAFDPQWDHKGLLMKVVEQAKDWGERQSIKKAKFEIVSENGFPPCLFVDIDGTGSKEEGKTVFFYGHLDKQPENTGWDANKSPWEPVYENGRLYGRGGADDGYSFYCAMAAISALDANEIDRPRCVGLFETCEESGSQHYEEYLKQLLPRLGDVGLVVALDSSCGDYERLWITASLRGMIGGSLEVQVLEQGVHSGEAGGIVPSSFMVLRNLLDRVEDSSTGKVIGKSYQVSIPEARIEQTKKAAKILKDIVWKQFPWASATTALSTDPLQALLSRNWQSSIAITGVNGMPSVECAGNVLRVNTTVKVTMRLPPTCNAKKAALDFEKTMITEVPFNAKVTFNSTVVSDGWEAPKEELWFQKSVSEASMSLWGEEAIYLGMGVSIPLLNVFSSTWPTAQFLVTGVLGPNANAHGPNEFLDVEFVKKLTASVASVVAQMPRK